MKVLNMVNLILILHLDRINQMDNKGIQHKKIAIKYKYVFTQVSYTVCCKKHCHD